MKKRLPQKALRGCLALALGSAWTSAAWAQEPPARTRANSIFFEMGSGWSSSLNYERMFTPRISARMGAGTAFDYVLERTSIEFIGMVDFAFFTGRHQVIAGVGGIVLLNGDSCPVVHAPGYCSNEPERIFDAEIGYRYRSRSGFLLRATVGRSPNPSNHYTDRKREHLVLPALSLGWSF
jgi:hypothetical protein